MRTGTGVQPTPRAERLADGVRTALGVLEAALNEGETFDPAASNRIFRLHMSDIGEGRFLPELMAHLHLQAPHVRVQTLPLPRDAITEALDHGRIDFALGFLPMVKDTRSTQLLHACCRALLRKGYPLLCRGRGGRARLGALSGLESVGARSHADSPRLLGLAERRDRL